LDTLKLLKQLSEISGPAGYEHAVADALTHLWQPLADEVRTDAMGNVIALQYATGASNGEVNQRLMLAAHMDEIGLIVTGLEGEFLRIHTLGGTDRRVLLGLEVDVHGREVLPGVIGARPPHVLPAAERNRIPPWHELFVDVGLPAERVRELVRVGDYVTPRAPLRTLKNDRAAGKALDNRASVAAVTLALADLRRRQHAWDIYAVATIQEEVGTKGATTSAYGIAPALAVALDVTFATQHDDSAPGTFALGSGPTIGVGPNFHPEIVSRLKQAAEAEEIPYVIEPLPGSSGTDAWAIQLAREGIPTGLISIPLRYMHQPVELVDRKDIERAARLLARFASDLEADFRPHWEDEL